MSTRVPAMACLLLLLAAGVATADEETIANPKRWHNETSFAFVHASGNSDLQTLDLREDLSWEPKPWAVRFHFSVVRGEEDGEEKTSHWISRLRLERELRPRLSAFGLVAWERDIFAGIERRWEEGAGIQYQLLEPKPHALRLDLGISAVQQRGSADGNDSFPSARIAADYRFYFTDDAYASQLVELLPNLEEGEDLRVNSETAVVAPLWGMLSLKASYRIKYDGLPEPDKVKTDKLFSTGVQLSF